MKWVNPRLHKLYDELRRELLTVPFYGEKADSKAVFKIICGHEKEVMYHVNNL